ncbi:MAG: acetyl-CoA carboxylase carboxyltransferase subunit alpha [candidate division KSB1 bacterium]|nr:acetyl-CoA carboxylase carboxyltransferase subunit alpha [candidate division KSB1 bacterium]MDZ7294082.1 acetyl-CoA carboxylase carboxyltransferase subunit alpha [candidate division KSB1 bacterium]MDZ7338472.1 acetyl-CoA carboxylase carboxyltransferase subunit alpha [candidate division KSB1 bacterium]MDZ7385352.1 acetyl-CoA carboxylase carboxyltransferase subunit alpha [candidate division KSB1 bacterium]MDZ7393516.1 acetyl-CoA carboxylase carboxyltransferase subunit alpha [candidate division
MGFVLDFERPLVELEKKIADLKAYSSAENVEITAEIQRLEEKARKLRKQIYARLTRWQRVQLARHPQRPYTLDYIEYMTTDFVELHGDRAFADDPALVGGIAKLDGKPIVIFGQQKGRDTKQKLYRNFGMMHPEGYRKALRLMKLAAKYRRPVISLVDTPGAYPGIGAEERGQAEAIARNLLEMSRLPVPIIVVIIGEGASGGALGIGVGDRVLMQENTWYSVISPEGCAAILYRDASKAPLAAEAMKVTAQDLLKMGVIDRIVPEPVGGAHHNPQEAAALVKQAILEELAPLEELPPDKLVRQRIEKYARMGAWQEK